MLRLLLLALLLANALFFTWSQGWLARAIGSTPYSEREPQRLDAQVRPEMIKVLPAPAAAASVPEPEPPAASPNNPPATSLPAGPVPPSMAPNSAGATPSPAADAASASASAPT